MLIPSSRIRKIWVWSHPVIIQDGWKMIRQICARSLSRSKMSILYAPYSSRVQNTRSSDTAWSTREGDLYSSLSWINTTWPVRRRRPAGVNKETCARRGYRAHRFSSPAAWLGVTWTQGRLKRLLSRLRFSDTTHTVHITQSSEHDVTRVPFEDN